MHTLASFDEPTSEDVGLRVFSLVTKGLKSFVLEWSSLTLHFH